MLKRIKHTFITLGIASGMTAGALFYLHNADTCRAMVLLDLSKHQQFMTQISDYAGTQDFLTTLTKGR